MAEVDPGDDTRRRYVVSHYRYDPERRERRHVAVAAFDGRRESERCLRRLQAGIARHRAAGALVDRHEHVAVRVRDAGSAQRAARDHLVRRMVEHGVDPGRWLDEHDLSPGLAPLRPAARGGPLTRLLARRSGGTASG